MALEPATPRDIPAIMAIERIPEYAVYLGNFTADEHAAKMADEDYRYFAWREDGRLVAFAILARLTDPSDIVLLKRIGTSDPGRGIGRQLMPRLIDWVFENTSANRFELDVSAANPRAERVYRREGFTHEGTVREVYKHWDGIYYSSHLFAMLRREWEALPRRAGRGG